MASVSEDAEKTSSTPHMTAKQASEASALASSLAVLLKDEGMSSAKIVTGDEARAAAPSKPDESADLKKALSATDDGEDDLEGLVRALAGAIRGSDWLE